MVMCTDTLLKGYVMIHSVDSNVMRGTLVKSLQLQCVQSVLSKGQTGQII